MRIIDLIIEKLSVLEIRREIFHICLSMSLLILLYFGVIDALTIFIFLIAGGMLSLISKYMRLPLIGWFLDKFERREQMEKFPGKGALSLFFGVLLTIKLFPENIAYASIMILAIGDPVSHFVGKIFGRIRNPWNRIKMIEGNLAGAVVSGIAASWLVNPMFSFIASFSALLVESIEIKMNEKIIDDNIILPLTAGTAMLLLETYAPAFI